MRCHAFFAGSLLSSVICLAQGPVVYYPFNGDANDSSGNNNHGTVYGATPGEDRFGISGKSYLFNGSSQRIQAPQIAEHSFGNGDFSVTSFINVRNVGVSRIVSAGYRDNDGIWGLGFGSHPVWGSGLRINYFVYSGNSYRDFNSQEITNYTVGQWAFVGISKSGSSLRFYFNGKLVGESAIGYPSNANSYLSIGCRQDNPNQFIEFFNGKLDDIRIYNRALSHLEMERMAGDGLVAHYRLDGNARDTSGNGYHGTVQQATSVANRFSHTNEGFAFNGTNAYLNVPHAEGLQISGTITLAAWAKRTRLGIDIILEKGGDWTLSTCNYGMGLHYMFNKMFYFYYRGGWRGTSGVQDTAWHHYAVVATQGDANPKLFIDGVQRPVEFGEGSPTIEFGTSTAALHIGAQLGTYLYYGANHLDEVYLYNRALDTLEIKRLAGNGLLAWYRMNGNSADSSGYAHHATNKGATLTTDRRFSADSAYRFNGTNQNMTAPEHPDWNFGYGDFSMVGWINLAQPATARIVSAGYDGNDGIWALGFGTNPAWGTGIRINYFVRSGNASQDFNSNEIQSYALGSWAFVGVIKKGTTLTFLYNNDTVGTAQVPFTSLANSYLVLGARQWNSPENIFEWWPGKLDDIRLYNRALTASDLSQLASTRYHFTGAGAWSDAANWEGSVKPPQVVPPNHTVIINPAGTNPCTVSGPVEISSGAQLILQPGKQLKIEK